jgi:dephospho-CoA kinase
LVEYCVVDNASWDRPLRGEESITKLRWLPIDENVSNADHFEYWSQLALRKFLPEMFRTEPSFRIARRKPLTPPHRLAIVGQVGSGKTEACRLLCDEFGYHEVRTGLIMADLLGIPPIPQTPRREFQRVAEHFISRPDGVERLAQAVYGELKSLETDRVLVDGLRHIATWERIAALMGRGKLGVLYIETPPDVAFRFYRSREDRQAGLMDFLGVRDGSGEEEVRAFLGQADAVIYNWFGRKRYLATVRRLMADLGISPARPAIGNYPTVTPP